MPAAHLAMIAAFSCLHLSYQESHMVVQNVPDVMDIEVSPASGEWRVVGSQGAWMSISVDPSQLLDSSVLIKPEPQLGSAAPAQGAAGGAALPYSSCRHC